MPDKILLIVIDQFRADCLNGALANSAPLPNLTALMNDAACFERHFTVTTPCGPSRASLLTGLYAMNHRSVRNGTPLASHHQTIGTHLRSAGYDPMLFGYTDTSADPSGRHTNDPDLKNYEGLAPGFAEIVRLRLESSNSWVGYLKSKGYQLPDNYWDLYKAQLSMDTATKLDPQGSPIRSQALYRSEDSDTAFLTTRTIEELSARESQAWFSLVTYIRPHPPLVAPAPYNTLFSPESIPAAHRPLSLDQLKELHPFYQACFSEPSGQGLYIGFDGNQDALHEQHVAELRAVYLGLAREVDDNIGRLLGYLRDSGQYEDTLIVVTADHGEMLGDHYQWGKNCPSDAALHIPLIIRDPKNPDSFGRRITAFTESVDIAPTLAEWVCTPEKGSYDGSSLLPWLSDTKPDNWRNQVFCEAELGEPDKATLYQRYWNLPAEQCNYAMLRSDTFRYVHFNGGIAPMLHSLGDDGSDVDNHAGNPAYAHELYRMAASMLDHRMRFANRTLSSCKLTESGLFKARP